MKLSLRTQRWFYAVFGVLFFSGLLWLISHYILEGPGDFSSPYHQLEAWLIKIHGGAAMLSLLVLGVLIPTHMRLGWKQHRNRRSGIIIASTCMILVVSGYGLYYLGNEQWRSIASWMHSALGVGFPLILLIHILMGRGKRRGRPHRSQSHKV